MKSILFLISILLILDFTCFAEGYKTFVPKNDGYESIEIKVEPKSINNICKSLGYNTDQFYTYFNFDNPDSKIVASVFKIFTDEIICVLTKENVVNISENDVKSFLTKFDLKKQFDSYTVESTLEDGVENKSLTKDFLSDVLNFDKNSNNQSFVVPKIGYELKFSNGILSSFSPSDGLNKWAKMWKNELPSLYKQFLETSRKYQENEADILNEINIQADAFSRLPDGYDNEYLNFHKNPDGTINFKMLLVAHYNETITLKEFKEINKGRYSLSNEYNDNSAYKRTTFRINKTLYTFDENGKFVNSYTSE